MSRKQKFWAQVETIRLFTVKLSPGFFEEEVANLQVYTARRFMERTLCSNVTCSNKRDQTATNDKVTLYNWQHGSNDK